MKEPFGSKLKRFVKELLCCHKYIKPVSVTFCEKCGKKKKK